MSKIFFTFLLSTNIAYCNTNHEISVKNKTKKTILIEGRAISAESTETIHPHGGTIISFRNSSNAYGYCQINLNKLVNEKNNRFIITELTPPEGFTCKPKLDCKHESD